MAKSVVLQSKVSEGSYRNTLLISLALHVLLVVAISVISIWHPFGREITVGTSVGGGRGGDTIPISLADELDGGTGQYMPSLKPQPPAVELPKPKEPKETAIPLPELAKPEKEAKPKKEAKKQTQQEGEKPPKKQVRVPKNFIPRPTGPGTGEGAGMPGGSGGGFGGGIGINIGSGSGGGGTDDSWYARLVQQRISSNWLRSLIGNVSGSHETVISFYVRDNGTITGISVEKPSGVRTLDDSARRAIEISNPLAPLPYELRGKAVRFVAHFPYPPPRQ